MFKIKCALWAVVVAFLVGCGATREHVFIDNTHKCSTPVFSVAFDEVESMEANDLNLSPLEVKSALLQAFSENGCMSIAPSSLNVVQAAYTTKIEENTQKGLFYNNSNIKITVSIILNIKGDGAQQMIEGFGYLDLKNEKYLGIGSSQQIARADKSYVLSIASRMASKTLAEKMQDSTQGVNSPSSSP